MFDSIEYYSKWHFERDLNASSFSVGYLVCSLRSVSADVCCTYKLENILRMITTTTTKTTLENTKLYAYSMLLNVDKIPYMLE